MLSRIPRVISVFSEDSRTKAVGLVFLVFAASLFESASVGLFFPFLNIIADPNVVHENDTYRRVYEFFGEPAPSVLLTWMSLVLIFFTSFKNVFMASVIYLQNRFIFEEQAKTSRELLAAYIALPWSFHLQRNLAQVVRTVVKSVDNMFSNFVGPMMTVVSDFFVIAMIMAILLYVQPIATIGAAGILGVAGTLFARYFRNKINRWGHSLERHESEMIRRINQTVGGMKELKVLNRGDFFVEQFSALCFGKARSQIGFHTLGHAPRLMYEVIILLTMMLVLLLLLISQKGETSDMSAIPILGLFGVAAFRMMPSMSRISNSFVAMRYGLAAVDHVYEDLERYRDLVAKHAETPETSGPFAFNERITLNDVSFQYAEANVAAVNGVTITIPKGAAVAFVGPSGAGKTTISDLILGVLEPTHGSILVDGNNIHDSITKWQHKMGYVPQAIFLADDTLRRNIAFGISDDEIDEGRVLDAVRHSYLEDVLKTLPQGLDTDVGERGVRLSGGQRQRVGIARALYNSPEVIVLDEATSSLDNTSEREITRAIDLLSGEVTVIVIAHRLTTVQGCDCIFFMMDGRVVEQGTYEELLEKSEDFRRMVQLGEFDRHAERGREEPRDDLPAA